MFVFNDPSHDEIKDKRRTQTDDSSVNKRATNFVLFDAQFLRPPLANTKGSQFKKN